MKSDFTDVTTVWLWFFSFIYHHICHILGITSPSGLASTLFTLICALSSLGVKALSIFLWVSRWGDPTGEKEEVEQL